MSARKSSNMDAFRASLKANKDEDRITADNAVTNLQLRFGPPSKQRLQALWVERFNVFREVMLGDPDLSRPITIDNIIGFLRVAVAHIRSNVPGHPAVSSEIFRSGVVVLSQVWCQADAKNTMSKLELDWKCLEEQLVSEGAIIRGLAQEKNWVSFQAMSRMASSWLRLSIEEARVDWDMALVKIASVVLASACSAKAVDVAWLSSSKDEQHLLWKDVQLVLKDKSDYDYQPPQIANLECRIVLRGTKEKKGVAGRDVEIILNPLLNSKTDHVCPVLYLLILMMRFGQTTITNVPDLLLETQRHGGRVRMCFPDRPVLPALTESMSPAVDLDKSASTEQMSSMLREIERKTNTTGQLMGQGLRSEAANDVSTVLESESQFRNLQVVRRALHLSPRSTNASIMKYVDPNPEYVTTSPKPVAAKRKQHEDGVGTSRPANKKALKEFVESRPESKAKSRQSKQEDQDWMTVGVLELLGTKDDGTHALEFVSQFASTNGTNSVMLAQLLN